MRIFEHNDNFEQFLKNAADNFSMKPTIKVWNSIYNNFHPSRKNPSLGTVLFFIISLFVLNAYNTHSTIQINNHHSSELIIRKNTKNYFKKINPIINTPVAISFKKNKTNSMDKKILLTAPEKELIVLDSNQHIITINERIVADENANTNEQIKTQQLNFISSGKTSSNNNHPTIAKLNSENEMSYQLYASSSVGYLNNNKPREIGNTNSNTNNSEIINETGKFLKLLPEFNLEAGGAVLLNISAAVKLKAGMQLNYTNYTLRNEQDNPGSNNDLNNSSSGGNADAMIQAQQANQLGIYDKSKLSSSTYQISLPLGTELELIGNHQLKWFAGATIQPSYLVSDYSFSGNKDIKNYFQDGGFRKWNINTSFETYLSYKLPNGSRINAGPQFRYQLFSSYDNKYLYNERMYNVGLKLGISKNL